VLCWPIAGCKRCFLAQNVYRFAAALLYRWRLRRVFWLNASRFWAFSAARLVLNMCMRKDNSKQFASTNGTTAKNGNFSVKLDFSSDRPTVEIRGTGEHNRWSNAAPKRFSRSGRPGN